MKDSLFHFETSRSEATCVWRAELSGTADKSVKVSQAQKVQLHSFVYDLRYIP